MTRRLCALAVAAVLSAAAMPVALDAQVVTSGTWTSMVIPDKDAVPFWDGASADAINGSSCNVSYFLLYAAGSGYGSCANQQISDAFTNANAGRLGLTGGMANGSFLSGATTSTPVEFAFAAGTYRLEFLASVSGFGMSDQQLWAYSGPASAPVQEQQLYGAGSFTGSGSNVVNVTFNSEWYLGARSAAAGNAWTFSNDVASPRYALFSEVGAADVKDYGRFWAGFGDTPNGDQDFNDLVLEIQAQSLVTTVPEPSTWALMVFGLGTIGVVARRRRGR